MAILDAKLELLEKSLERAFCPRPHKPADPSSLEIALFRTAKWSLVAGGTYLYASCHDWPFLFGGVMTLLFAYLFAGLVHFCLDFVVYVFSEPLLLAEIDASNRANLFSQTRVALIRPVFASTVSEMDMLFVNLLADLSTHADSAHNLKFVMLDNSREEEVRAYARRRIQELQAEYGEDVVFYFHRDIGCSFFNKLGIYQDFVMLLEEGWTRPRAYTGPQWKPWVGETRNPEKPVWDEILGDVRALGVQEGKQEILRGGEVTLSANRIRFAFVCDADNLWPKGQVEKILAKMLHPENESITIFQPRINLANPEENGYIRLNAWSRNMYGFDPIAKWRLYRFSPFYGKGAMRLDAYARDIIKSEALHPGKSASHDFQESLKTPTVLLEDALVLERTFSNKLSELTRGEQWNWGDIETVKQFLPQRFEAGRKEHLWMLLRVSVGTFVYALWLLGSIAAWTGGLIINAGLLWALFLSAAAVNLAIPGFLIPYVNALKDGGSEKQVASGRPSRMGRILTRGLYEAVFSTLIHSLDLLYKPYALLRNLVRQAADTHYVWVTGAMSEIKTQGLSLQETYRALRVAPCAGGLLLLGSLTGYFPPGLSLFLLPYTAAFLIGPYAVWYTAKPEALAGK